MAVPRLKKNLAPGTRITVREQEWVVRECRHEPELDTRVVTCEGVAGITRGVIMTFIDVQDQIKIVDPLDIEFSLDKSAKFRESKLWIDTWARKVVPTDNALVIGHRGVVDPLPYQRVPAAMALDTSFSVRPRILIADAVGLGKTIEVGILLSELIKRGRARRILVVVLKSMMTQFQKEMWSRFSIALEALDREKIEQIAREIPRSMNPLDQRDRVIVSIDTLKQARQLSLLENSRWDVIVIDECHNVAKRSSAGTQRSRLAKVLAKTSESLILTSATPHDGTAASYASLLELLDPLLVVDPAKITQANMAPVTIQRYAKDVRGTDYKRCVENEHRVELDKDSVEVLKKLSNKVFEVLGEKPTRKKDIFFRTTLSKAMMSSPEACSSILVNRLSKISVDYAKNGKTVGDHQFLEGLKKDIEQLSLKKSKKFEKLLEIIGSIPKKSRIVIFTEYLQTQEYLASELSAALKLKLREDAMYFDKNDQIVTFSGAQPELTQQEILESFQSKDSKIRILIATDVASEGVNLHHYCSQLIHFDIPWSLITICQRNGRIDRYGQNEDPQVHYLIAKTFDPVAAKLSESRVVDVLIERARQAKEQMGNVGVSLGVYDALKEEEKVAIATQNDSAFGDDLFSSSVPEISQTVIPNLDVKLVSPWRPYQVNASNVGDLTFIKEAAAFLGAQPREKSDNSVTFDISGENLAIVGQLRALNALKSELALKKQTEIIYTDQASKMEEAIIASRQKAGNWPSHSFAWEVNPAVDALAALVEAKFPKDRVQILTLPDESSAGFLGFIVYRALYDDSGHPIFSRLEFAQRARKEWLFREPQDALADIGWNASTNNPAIDVSNADIKDLRVEAKHLYDSIKFRCDQEAGAGSERRKGEVARERQRAMDWYRDRKKYLRDSYSRPNQRRRLEDELKHLDDLRDRHRDFIDRYANVESSNLYVRIVAAFVGVK